MNCSFCLKKKKKEGKPNYSKSWSESPTGCWADAHFGWWKSKQNVFPFSELLSKGPVNKLLLLWLLHVGRGCLLKLEKSLSWGEQIPHIWQESCSAFCQYSCAEHPLIQTHLMNKVLTVFELKQRLSNFQLMFPFSVFKKCFTCKIRIQDPTL